MKYLMSGGSMKLNILVWEYGIKTSQSFKKITQKKHLFKNRAVSSHSSDKLLRFPSIY